MIKAKHVIAISSNYGDPRHSGVWSGTSSNVLKAIESLGVNVVGINSSPLNRYQRRAYMLVNQLSGYRLDPWLEPTFRAWSAKKLHRQIQALGCTKILHMGQLDLPMPKLDPGVEHYLMCDVTRNAFTKFSANIDQLTPKMLQRYEQLERESFAQIKHFFPMSEYVRDNLIDHYKVNPNKITVVGTGAGNIKPFTGDKDYRNGHILFVAIQRFKEKGGFLLIEGFKLAQRKNPSLKLIVVGNDQYRQMIGSVPNVRVTGFMPPEELQNLFNTAALFAMPSLNEAWGLVYIEALACKNPILGLNRNSLPEITCDGQYGFLVDEPTAERVADAILQAFSNPDKLSEMGAAGQRYCLEKFSWNRVATKIASVMLGTPAPLLQSLEKC
jgi:glycosyltransferase involved in cell wall biosynthesis